MEKSRAYIEACQKIGTNDPAGLVDLEVLAKGGDAYAQMAFGELCLQGKRLSRSTVKGFRWIEKAARSGLPAAQRANIYLTNKGIGRKADPKRARRMLGKLAETDRFAAVQLQLLDHATSRETVRRIKPEIISKDPRIVIWRGLFSPAEYGYLRRIAEPLIEPAMVVNPATGKGVRDPIRKSFAHSFTTINEDLMLQEIVASVAIATGRTPLDGEPLTVLRYQPGEEYKAHYDAYDRRWAGPQRKHTALIWLNDDYEGGETHFPRLDIAVRGNPGDMMVFDNLTADGDRDDRMEHAGMPVTTGEKWLASRWVTEAAPSRL